MGTGVRKLFFAYRQLRHWDWWRHTLKRHRWRQGKQTILTLPVYSNWHTFLYVILSALVTFTYFHANYHTTMCWYTYFVWNTAESLNSAKMAPSVRTKHLMTCTWWRQILLTLYIAGGPNAEIAYDPLTILADYKSAILAWCFCSV